MRERQRKVKTSKRKCREGFPGGSGEKGSAAMQETWVRFLPLEGEGNGNPPRTLAWRIPWAEGPAGYSRWGRRVRLDSATLRSLSLSAPWRSHTPQSPSACASAFELGSRAWQLQLPERGLPRALLRSQRSLHPATGGQPLLPETGAEPAEQQGPTAAKKQMSK